MEKDNMLQEIGVREAEIPEIITSSFTELKKLQTSVVRAMKKAEDAKESADRARDKSAGLFHKKEAIESLQTATVDLAESQIMAAEAQKVSFEYQERLGKITQYLFALGVTNLAANRTVVRELEAKLKGASEKELGELAKREIISVVKQLKAQEDIMVRQQQLSEQVRKHDQLIARQAEINEEQDSRITEQFRKGEEQDRIISEQIKKDKEQDVLIAEQAQKDAEHDRLLTEQAQKDAEHDRLIAEQAQKDAEHDRLIAEQAQKDAEHDRLIAEQAQKDAEHDRLIAEQAQKDAEHDRLIAEQAQKDAEHDRLIAEQTQKNAEHDRLIAEQAQKDAEHDRLIAEQADRNESQDRLLGKHTETLKQQEETINLLKTQVEELKRDLDTKTSKTITYISIGVAAAAVVLGVLQFIL